MTRRIAAIALLAGLSALCVRGAAGQGEPNTLTPEEKAAGWMLLFDGKTLNGWQAVGKPEGWAVEGGAIACLVRGGEYLRTTEQYGDFALAVDFKVDRGVNSGIFVRWSDLKDPVNTGIEVQVFDSYGSNPPGKHDNGAIYDLVAPVKNTTKPAGEWNHAVITCRGPRLAVELNGERVAQIILDDYSTAGKNPDGSPNKFKYALRDFARRGYIGLQDHGGRVWFRNLKIRTRLPAP